MFTRRSFLVSTAAAGAVCVPAVRLFAKSALAGVRARGEWPVGVCSWSYEKPIDVVAAEMAKIGVNRIHLALGPALEGDRICRASVERHLAAGDFTLSAAMIGFAHEDWTTLDSIRRTGGIVPDAYWDEYKKTIAPAAKLAAAWKAPFLTLHAGFLDESNPAALAKYTDRVKFIRDACAASGIGLLLETGQETAADLAEFLSTVTGVGVNFDPANMILYAKGDPVAAVKTLAPWIRHVHIKDAKKTAVPGTWGTEVPWGTGEVHATKFLDALVAAGFKGSVAIEREAGTARATDIAAAVKSLAGFRI